MGDRPYYGPLINDHLEKKFTIPEKEITTEDFDILEILNFAPHEISEKRGQSILLKNVIYSFSLAGLDSILLFLLSNVFNLHYFVVPVYLIISLIYNLYSRRFPLWDEIGRITGVFLFTSLLYIFNDFSRLSLDIFLFLLIGTLVLSIGRFALKDILWILGLRERVIIVGGGLAGLRVLKSIDSERSLGYDVVGVLDDDRAKLWKPVWKFRGRDVLVIGRTTDIWNILKETHVDEVILAIPSLGDKALTALASHLQKFVPKVSVVPDMFGLPVLAELRHSFGHQVLFLTVQNKLANPLNRFLKELMDKIISLLIFVMLFPLLIIISIAIKLDSPGPVIFSQERVGKNGKKFKCYKFRTMYVNNQEILQKYLEENQEFRDIYMRTGKIPGYDPRITRVGKFLRKFSLDELPQIINVLKGDMSLVGPRALVPEEVERCSEYYMEWAKYIKPGITGLAQVMGRANISHEDKNVISVWYMKNWSIWLDIVIILRTIAVVVRTEGAY